MKYKKILIAFRGTTSIVDWIYNLDVRLINYPKCTDCEVHKGFYTSIISVKNTIIEEVVRLQNLLDTEKGIKKPEFEILVTGHSLGAAMATLLTLELLPVKEPRYKNNIRRRVRANHLKDQLMAPSSFSNSLREVDDFYQFDQEFKKNDPELIKKPSSTTAKDIFLPIRLINFGSPRVGNENFAKYASDTISSQDVSNFFKD